MAASAGAIRAGRAFMEIGADDSLLRKTLKSGEKRLKQFGAVTAKIAATLAGLGTAMAAPLFMAIKAGSDLQETMNKFNVVFGENAKAVKAWGDEYGEQVGRSERQIADFMGSNQDLLVPMGFEDDAATEMSKQITQLAVDLASFNNMQDSDTLRDLQAALTGSGEVMKKYGVIVSQTAVNQELLNMGLDPKTVTEAEKAQARFAIIMRGTTAAQGDAIRSANSWANQKKALAAEIENVSGKIGNVLLPIVTPLLTKIVEVVKQSGQFIENNKEMVVVIAAVSAGLIAAGVAFGGLSVASIAAASALSVLGTAAAAVGTVFGVIFSPIGLVLGALAAIVAISVDWEAAAVRAGDKANDLAKVFQETFGLMKKAIDKGKFELAARLLMKTIEVEIRKGLDNITSIWDSSVDGSGEFFVRLGSIFEPTVELERRLKALQEEQQGQRSKSGTKAAQRELTDIKNEIENLPGKPPEADGQPDDQPVEAKKPGQPAVAKKPVLDGSAKNEFTLNVNAKDLPELNVEEVKFPKLQKLAEDSQQFEPPRLSSTGGMGSNDLRTQAGLQSLVNLFNQSGDDQSLKAQHETNSLLVELIDKVDSNGIQILEAG